jgi:hypothetical protein
VVRTKRKDRHTGGAADEPRRCACLVSIAWSATCRLSVDAARLHQHTMTAQGGLRPRSSKRYWVDDVTVEAGGVT